MREPQVVLRFRRRGIEVGFEDASMKGSRMILFNVKEKQR